MEGGRPEHCTSEERGGEPCLDPETLSAFLDGSLEAPSRARVEQIVDECELCRSVVAELVRGERSAERRDAVTVPGRPGLRPSSEPSGGDLPKLSPGARLGRFVLERRLGAGGMGVVWLARDPKLDRPVAVKLLHLNLGLGGLAAELESRMLREAQAMAKLSHPAVVQIFDVGTVAEQIFLAMEYVEGQTLASWLDERERSVAEVLEAFSRAGEGLAAAHEAGLVHRDFKPHNVLVGAGGRVKVTDFGLARAAADNREGELSPTPGGLLDVELTYSNAVVGTPAYLSPEQREGRGADARSDQYSFCVALFDAVTRQSPSSRDVDVLSAAPEAIERRLLRAGLRRRPSRAVARGLARDPADRLASMEALLAEIDPKRRKRRRAWMAVALAALVAAGASGVAASMWLGGSPPCEEAGRPIESLWNRDRREALESAFAATGRPFARAGAKLVASSLDRFAAQWSDRAVETCRVVEAGSLAASEAEPRRACLAKRKQEAKELIEELSHADSETVAGALDEVRGLTPVASCLDPSTPLPPAARSRKEIHALRNRLALAARDLDDLKLADAEKAAAAVAKEASEVGYGPLEAEATLLVGRARSRQEKVASAGESLGRAMELAEEQSADIVRARAFLALTAAARRAGDYKEALKQGRQAMSLVDRIGPDPAAEILVITEMARTQDDQGDVKAALASYRQAAERARSTYGAKAPETAAAMTLRADALRRFRRDLEGASSLCEKALQIFEAEGADRPAKSREHARALSVLASVRLDAGEPDAAVELLERAVDAIERRYGGRHPLIARYRARLALALARAGRSRESDEAIRSAFDLTVELFGEKDVRVARARGELGRVLLELGRDQEAAATLKEALDTGWRLGFNPLDMVKVGLASGDAFMHLGQADEASSAYTLASATAFQKLHAHSPWTAMVWRKRAEGDVRTGFSGLALTDLREAVKILDANGGPKRELARTAFELARRLVATKGMEHDPKGARALAEKARDIYASLGEPDRAEEISSWLETLPEP